jgi:hypothetical protein
MNTRENGTPTPASDPVDLTQETEDTRRKLYAAAVATHFTPTPEEPVENGKAKADPDNWQPPAYTPDPARLTIHQLYGRWIVTWRRLEEKEGEARPDLLWAVLRVIQNPETGELEYHEV